MNARPRGPTHPGAATAVLSERTLVPPVARSTDVPAYPVDRSLRGDGRQAVEGDVFEPGECAHRHSDGQLVPDLRTRLLPAPLSVAEVVVVEGVPDYGGTRDGAAHKGRRKPSPPPKLFVDRFSHSSKGAVLSFA